MSVDVNWESLTGGSDGADLAEAVRSFMDDRFQQIELPRFIHSVKVHSFDFGSVAPQVELKDICDPLPEFYEEDDDDEKSEGSDAGSADDGLRDAHVPAQSIEMRRRHRENGQQNAEAQGTAHSSRSQRPARIDTRTSSFRNGFHSSDWLGSPSFTGGHIQGIPGGTSNMSYFHLPLGAGLSGTTTPLAAVAGAQFHNNWPENNGNQQSHGPTQRSSLQQVASATSSAEPSVADVNSRPSSEHQQRPVDQSFSSNMEAHERTEPPDEGSLAAPHLPRMRAKSPEDIQVVLRVTYSGDVQISMTAEILLDYPMPSFVGIPVKVKITGLTFDGLAILAYMRKRVHFCFLSPEDADTLVGGESQFGELGTSIPKADMTQLPRLGGLLEDMKVECQIGETEDGKQVLKNVGKVEKFVLEQVRRTFEDEMVYPSFWTFLV